MRAAGKNSRETTGGDRNLLRTLQTSIRFMESKREQRGMNGSVQMGKEELKSRQQGREEYSWVVYS